MSGLPIDFEKSFDQRVIFVLPTSRFIFSCTFFIKVSLVADVDAMKVKRG